MVADVDWIELCRRVVAGQRELFAGSSASAERTVYEGRGEGGDMTLELDRRCEDLVFEQLEPVAANGTPLLVISEERGEVVLGDGEPAARVIVDPIDGSLNVRRTVPSHSLSIAVAGGPTMADVDFGFVHDFGADEEFAAHLGQGATLDGAPIRTDAPDTGLEIVGLESAEPSWILPAIERLQGKAYRLRSIGSIAITLSYVAAGRFDAMLSARQCRSVDAAAAQLIVREVGGSIEFAGHELDSADLGLEARYAVAAGRSPEHLRVVREAQEATPMQGR